jgi:hypothetical protein
VLPAPPVTRRPDSAAPYDVSRLVLVTGAPVRMAAAWLHGCMAAWLHGCASAHGCTAARLHGCMAAWLQHGGPTPPLPTTCLVLGTGCAVAATCVRRMGAARACACMMQRTDLSPGKSIGKGRQVRQLLGSFYAASGQLLGSFWTASTQASCPEAAQKLSRSCPEAEVSRLVLATGASSGFFDRTRNLVGSPY